MLKFGQIRKFNEQGNLREKSVIGYFGCEPCVTKSSQIEHRLFAFPALLFVQTCKFL